MHGWNVNDTFARPGGDLWQVGSEGVTLRWNGTTWSAHDSGTTSPLNGVWAVLSNAWAVGNDGTVVHWTGSAWSSVAAPSTANLLSVAGSSDTDVWVGAVSGGVHHWTGSGWSGGECPAAALTIGGNQVVGPRLEAVPSPYGGTIIDAEARAAVEAVIVALRTHGLIE